VKAAHPDQPLEWWVQDEARIGQQGTLTSVWAETGSRPQQVRQTEYQWVYVYAAVNAVTGASSAMLAPTVNTDYMNAHLEFITAGSHAIVVLDRAGWHVAKALKVPANLTLLHLPPYSPELNPVERVWAYMRSHYMSNRVFKDYDELFDLTAAAWNRIEQERLKSICHSEWIERAL
jgi:putative transposase